jgi:AAA15 family ATPase/GTPase
MRDYMKVSRFFVSGFKNLVDCDITLQGLHVITGCNGIGKSNLLSAFVFIKELLTASEGGREMLLSGYDPFGRSWIPMRTEGVLAPVFIVEGEVEVNGVSFNFSYKLVLSKPEMNGSPYSVMGEIKIEEEFLRLKEVGKPGKPKEVLSRDEGYATFAVGRKKSKFSVLNDMSALSALRIREANDFSNNFPVVELILQALSSTNVLALNPQILEVKNQYFDDRNKASVSKKSLITRSINLYEAVKELMGNEFSADQLNYWLKILLRIDAIKPVERVENEGEESEAISKYLYVTQDGKLLFPKELSSGSITMLAMLIILLSPRLSDSVLLIEEPESYIHPKAISDLMILLKDLAEENTIIVSTHSPVVINSLEPSQVSVLCRDDQGMTKASLVSSIDSAMSVLDRGSISFGDLLQSDFKYD